MLDIYSPIVRNTAISFETQPRTLEELRGRIRASLGRRLWLVCNDKERVAGYAYATQFNPRDSYIWSVEVSVYVHPDHYRRGMRRVLYTSLFACLPEQGYCTAVARITLPDPASVSLHESMGFLPVGVNEGIGYKNGQWHDVGIWQLQLRPRQTQPATPLPCTALFDTTRWARAISSGERLIKG